MEFSRGALRYLSLELANRTDSAVLIGWIADGIGIAGEPEHENGGFFSDCPAVRVVRCDRPSDAIVKSKIAGKLRLPFSERSYALGVSTSGSMQPSGGGAGGLVQRSAPALRGNRP